MSYTFALWASILLGATGQILLRRGLSTGAAQTSARARGYWIGLITSPWVWGYGLCFCGAMVLWLIAIAHVAISYAFPLLSAGYIFVALLSPIVLIESVGPKRWTAIAVLSIGVILIAAH